MRRRLTTLIGVVHDYPPADGGVAFDRALRLAFDDSPTAGLEVITRIAEGLPRGSADAVRQAFRELDTAGVVAVIGPAISDNALAVLPLVDELRIPTINYTGTEMARSEFMFHYQLGSLEEEPFVLAHHLAARRLFRVGLVKERSFIGEQLAAAFEDACRRHQVEVHVATTIAADGHDAAEVVGALRERMTAAIVYLGLGTSARALGDALAGLDVPVLANSALMFGYALPEWTASWEGWVYVDALSEGNAVLARLRERWGVGFPAGPGVPSAYDLGGLIAEGIARASSADRAGLKRGLERVKRLPAALGADGTTMGFGRWERNALKGDFLLLRTWRHGVSEPWTPDGETR